MFRTLRNCNPIPGGALGSTHQIELSEGIDPFHTVSCGHHTNVFLPRATSARLLVSICPFLQTCSLGGGSARVASQLEALYGRWPGQHASMWPAFFALLLSPSRKRGIVTSNN